MEWMILPLKRYADFEGRSRRKEYWMFTLGILALYVVLAAFFFVAADAARDRPSSAGIGMSVVIVVGIGAIVVLGLFLPWIAVQVRRLHDQDKSGWFILLGFIPYIGGLIMLVFMCIDGTPGQNRFGDDPKGRGDYDRYETIFGGPDPDGTLPPRPPVA